MTHPETRSGAIEEALHVAELLNRDCDCGGDQTNQQASREEFSVGVLAAARAELRALQGCEAITRRMARDHFAVFRLSLNKQFSMDYSGTPTVTNQERRWYVGHWDKATFIEIASGPIYEGLPLVDPAARAALERS